METGHVPNSQADSSTLDAPVAGSGQTFDWAQLDTIGLTQPFFIAGGLNEDNVVQAIQHFTPLCSRCIERSGDRWTKRS